MKISRIAGIILIILSLGIGYIGFNQVREHTGQIKIFGIEFKASNESERNKGYFYLGIAGVLLLGGLYSLRR
jgi:hypothetical protein